RAACPTSRTSCSCATGRAPSATGPRDAAETLMKHRVRSVLLMVAVATGPLRPAHAGDAAAPPRAALKITMAEAIDAALSHNPELAIATETIAAANARAAADATLRLPLLAVRANALLWNTTIVADLGADIGKIVSRDRAAAEASRAQRDGLRIDVAYRTAEAYLDALQSATLGQVAEATLHQLDADLQHAKTLLQAGTLQRVDVLRLEVERARVEQQRLQAGTAALGAR